MKVNGNFDVIDIATGNRISGGGNVFTNFGKQHFCNWLLHDNYSQDVAWDGSHNGQGGRSVSDMKVVPYSDITQYRVGTHSYVENPSYCLYPHNANTENYMRLYAYNQYWNEQSGNYNDQYGSIFFEFGSARPIQGIMIFGYQTHSWDYQHKMQFATSPDTFADAQTGNTWTVQHVDHMPTNWTSTTNDNGNRHIMYRFDRFDYPNRIVDNVRSFRIRTSYSDLSQCWGNYYGIWFLQANPYPNTPSAIGLGTDDTAPAAANTALGAQAIKKFILKHKTVDDNQVKYTMRLDKAEGNNTTFKEVGLFVNPTAGDYIGGDHQASVCTGMMSRGLFDTPWSKTSAQVIDIDYTLTLNN